MNEFLSLGDRQAQKTSFDALEDQRAWRTPKDKIFTLIALHELELGVFSCDIVWAMSLGWSPSFQISLSINFNFERESHILEIESLVIRYSFTCTLLHHSWLALLFIRIRWFPFQFQKFDALLGCTEQPSGIDKSPNITQTVACRTPGC